MLPDFERADRIDSTTGTGAPGCTEPPTRGRLLQGFLHSHDGEIATES